MSAVPAQPAVEPVAVPRALARRLALPLVFVVATLYHFLQSRGHATPTVFNDELLYEKLSQSLAAGHGLAIRGETKQLSMPIVTSLFGPAQTCSCCWHSFTSSLRNDSRAWINCAHSQLLLRRSRKSCACRGNR